MSIYDLCIVVHSLSFFVFFLSRLFFMYWLLVYAAVGAASIVELHGFCGSLPVMIFLCVVNSVSLFRRIKMFCSVRRATIQNRQHAQPPYLGQVWRAIVCHRSMFTDLISSGTVYCVAHAGQKTAISIKCLQFWGSTAHPFTDPGQIWQETVDHGLYAYTSNFIWVRLLAKFWHLVWGSCTSPYTNEGQIWYARVHPWSTLRPTCQISSQLVYCLSRAVKTPNFAVFWIKAFFDDAAYGESRTWVHNYKPRSPYPTVTKSFLCPNAFTAKSCTVHTISLSLRSTTDEQADKRLNVFGRPGGGWSPSQTQPGTVIEDLNMFLQLENVWGSGA